MLSVPVIGLRSLVVFGPLTLRKQSFISDKFSGGDLFGRKRVTFVFFVFFVVNQTGLLDRHQPQAVNHIDHIERDAFVAGQLAYVLLWSLDH